MESYLLFSPYLRKETVRKKKENTAQKVIFCDSYINKDEKVHRYTVREEKGREIERDRKRERNRGEERERERGY